MPTTFANTINGDEILAKRSKCDYAGNDIQATYATKSELPTATSDLTNDSGFITSSDVPVKDVQVDGESVVNAQGVAEISMPTFTQVNADWDASSGVQEILHKPDLSIYAESSDLATVATSGSYNDLLDKPSIPSAQVNADWDATSGVSEILNKPNLATVATTGDYSDLQNLPSIPAAQVNSDWTATSGVAEILHKPSIPTATSDLTNDSDFITSSDIPVKDVEVDGTSVVNANGVAEINLSSYATTQALTTGLAAKQDTISDLATIRSGAALGATSVQPSDLATVAVTGSYSDLSGTPTVDQTYDPTSANAQSGAAVADAISTKQDVISDLASIRSGAAAGATAVQQADLAPYATTSAMNTALAAKQDTLTAGTGIDITSNTISVENPLPASTSSDANKVLKVNAGGTPEWSTGGGGSQVNSDWDATSGVAEILNKPVPKTLTAGANISISEGQNTLTISAAAGKTYTGTDGVVVDNVNDTVGLEAPVDIVAGPGIVIDNPDGNTLRVSQATNYEVELYYSPQNHNVATNAEFVMSESIWNFSKVLITFDNMEFENRTCTMLIDLEVSDTGTKFFTPYCNGDTPGTVNIPWAAFNINAAGNIQYSNRGLIYGTWTAPQFTTGTSRGYRVKRVVGIHRIQGGS
jgi:hypothetical protein